MTNPHEIIVSSQPQRPIPGSVSFATKRRNNIGYGCCGILEARELIGMCVEIPGILTCARWHLVKQLLSSIAAISGLRRHLDSLRTALNAIVFNFLAWFSITIKLARLLVGTAMVVVMMQTFLCPLHAFSIYKSFAFFFCVLKNSSSSKLGFLANTHHAHTQLPFVLTQKLALHDYDYDDDVGKQARL